MPVHGHITEKHYLILKKPGLRMADTFFPRFRGEVFLRYAR